MPLQRLTRPLLNWRVRVHREQPLVPCYRGAGGAREQLMSIGPLNGLPAQHAFKANSVAQQNSLLRLSTGKKINRGADDPAGLISSEALSQALAALDAESRAVERNTSVANTADAALGEISDQMIEKEALDVAAANTGGLSDAERDAIQLEMDSISQSIDRTARSAEFNGQNLLDGSMEIPLEGGGHTIDAVSADTSVSELNEIRGSLGAFTRNGLESRQRSLDAETVNTAAARSQLLDTDYAEEAATLVRASILQQSSASAIRSYTDAQRQAILGLLDTTG